MPTYPSEFLYVNLEPRVPLSGTRAEVIFLLLVLPGHWTTLLLSDVLTNLAWDGLAGLLGNLPTLLYWLKSTLERNFSNRRFRKYFYLLLRHFPAGLAGNLTSTII